MSVSVETTLKIKLVLTAVDRRHLPQGIRRGLDETRHEPQLDAVLFLEVLLVGLAHVHQVRHVALHSRHRGQQAKRATSTAGTRVSLGEPRVYVLVGQPQNKYQ